MDISKKNKGSYGGSGLSISTQPEAWKRINRGGTFGDTHELTKPNGVFVDAHKVPKAVIKQIYLWGILNQYVVPQTLYNYCYYDDEMESEMRMTFLTREDAEENAYEPDEITKSFDFVGTQKLVQQTYQHNIQSVINPKDLMLALYVETTQPNIDGIYWNDILDVSRYSAPRGVIFNKKLTTWNNKIITKNK